MMADPSVSMVFLILGCGISAALLAMFVMHWWAQPKTNLSNATPWGGDDNAKTYVFRNGQLISQCEERDPFLREPSDTAGAWNALLEVLERVNPQIRVGFEDLQRSGRGFALNGQAGEDMLSVVGITDGDTLRISVSVVYGTYGKVLVDAEGHRRQRIEAEALRHTADAIPVVAWRETEDGQITWANASYFQNLESTQPEGEVLSWPPGQLFGSDLRPLPEPGQTRRCALSIRGRRELMWFEISAQPIGAEVLLTAVPAERLVAAEEALREFVQTLSKTFADLPIGLAIFDRRRELVLFNPALVSLSTLDAQFLSGRPTLFSFLDQLREKRQMPEPKNYKAWRESITKLEADAEEGTYHDLWTLPMGQTYRVIGRPHPGGAIAFMFEDISSEVSLTRQFRADLDLYQAAIDQNEAAIAVFSAAGQLVMSNAAYAELWGHDPRELLGVLSLKEATQRWQTATVPAPLWGEIRDFAAQRQDRVVWTDLLQIPNRGELFTQVSPLRSGATMLSFELVTEKPASAPSEDTASQNDEGQPA